MNSDALLVSEVDLLMMYGYWKENKADQESLWQLSFKGGDKYYIVAGLSEAIKNIQKFSIDESGLEYLANLHSFNPLFLCYLKQLEFSGTIDAVPEGTICFAHEPIISIKAPLVEGLFLGAIFRKFIGKATGIATQISRRVVASHGKVIVDFGGRKDALLSTQAAYIGGCEVACNALAKKMPMSVINIMTENWIRSFNTEQEAFRIFAELAKEKAVFLLDVYDPIQGLKNALSVGVELRRRKYDLFAVAMTKTNMSKIKKIRQILNRNDFRNTKICLIGNFSDLELNRLKTLPVDWIIMSDFVQMEASFAYQLLFINYEDHQEMFNPTLQIRRYYRKEKLMCDVVYDKDRGLGKWEKNKNSFQDLLIRLFENGRLLYKEPNVKDINNYVSKQVNNFVKNNSQGKVISILN